MFCIGQRQRGEKEKLSTPVSPEEVTRLYQQESQFRFVLYTSR